jgi:hypothetical protein
MSSEAMNDNPYASPHATSDGASMGASQKEGTDFGTIIWRWENLRIVYNASLTLFVLFLAGVVVPRDSSHPGFWVLVLLGACIANLCFFVGPAIEGYGTHFRFWNPGLTVLLFLMGLGLAALLALACILGYSGAIS